LWLEMWIDKNFLFHSWWVYVFKKYW